MIAYRDAQAGDAEAVAALHARSWRESYRGQFTDAFLDGDLLGERLAVWRERLERPAPGQLVLLALDGDALAGFVCAYADHDPVWGGFVDNLHVAREAKRSGIGGALMRRAGAWLARSRPGAGVYLWVLAANAPARRFYEGLGGACAETTRVETHGGATVRSCRYVWRRAESLASA